MNNEVYVVVNRCGFDGLYPIPIRLNDEYNELSDMIFFKGTKDECQRFIESKYR
jgi:hypothetical protein